MNILFITHLYPLSEESNNSFALHYFVREWNKNNNIQVLRIYYPMDDEPLPLKNNVEIDSVKIDIVKPFWIPILKKSFVRKKNILNLLRFNPDVIICHLYNSYFTFSFLKKYFDVPFIIGIHRSDVLLAKNLFYRWRINKSVQNTDLIVYRSLAIKNSFEKIIKTSDNTFIAWSGIPEFLIRKAKKTLQLSKSYKETKTFISVCRLIKLKQIDKVIESLNQLKQEGYNWKYTIIGDGPERKKLENLASKYSLKEQIFFLGRLPRERVFEILSENEFFVMPSYNETFGLAYLEAMANGCIVLGSEKWGIDGIIEDSYNGILCDAHDYESLFRKIKMIFNYNNYELKKIQSRSLKTVMNFNETEMAHKYLKAISEYTDKDYN
ncbi:MAG: glycosyltransferase [bacterium]